MIGLGLSSCQAGPFYGSRALAILFSLPKRNLSDHAAPDRESSILICV